MYASRPRCPAVAHADESQSSHHARQYPPENLPYQSCDPLSTSHLGRPRGVSGPATTVPARVRPRTRRLRWPASAAAPTPPESGQATAPPTSGAALPGDVHWPRDDAHREFSCGILAQAAATLRAAHQSRGPLAGPHPEPTPPIRTILHDSIYHRWLDPRHPAGPPALDRRHAHWVGHQGRPGP